MAEGQAGLSHQGRGGLFHLAKMLRFCDFGTLFAEFNDFSEGIRKPGSHTFFVYFAYIANIYCIL